MKSADCESCAIGRAQRGARCPFHDSDVAAGSGIFRQGEIPPSVWLVRSGVVLLSSSTRTGDETDCALRTKGALIGTEALVGRAAGYAAWALSDCSLCRLDGDSFRAWVGDLDRPAAAIAVLALDESERRRGERISLAGQAPRRVARLLVEQARFGGPLQVEQQILARMLGMAPETMSRALAKLRDIGALEAGRGIRIADLSALEAFADRG